MNSPAGVRETRASGFELHRTPDTLAPLEHAWRDLVASVPGSSYFATPDWVLGSWETMDPEAAATAEVAVWNGPDGRLEAVVPLVPSRGRLHPRIPLQVTGWTLLGADSDGADHGLLTAAPHRREEVRAWLQARTRGSSLWLPAMDPCSDAALLPPGTRRIARTTCPRLTVHQDIPVGSSGFRQLMRRRERQLTRCGISFRWVPPPQMTPELLDTVLTLHQVRQHEKGTATALGPHRRGLHLRLQERADPWRGPAALIAECDGTPVGAVYGFLCQKAFAYYNGGWDPAYARLSLGTVLLYRTITTVTGLGVDTFDFLRGDEQYKYHPFGACDRYDEQWLRPRSVTAALAGAALWYGRKESAPRAAGGRADRTEES